MARSQLSLRQPRLQVQRKRPGFAMPANRLCSERSPRRTSGNFQKKSRATRSTSFCPLQNRHAVADSLDLGRGSGRPHGGNGDFAIRRTARTRFESRGEMGFRPRFKRRCEMTEQNVQQSDATEGYRPLLIGSPAPQFVTRTTMGNRSLDQYRGRWLILFSHPADFTPVCTSEFISFSKAYPKFQELGCDLLALSIDSLFSHLAWVRSIRERFGVMVLSRSRKIRQWR